MKYIYRGLYCVCITAIVAVPLLLTVLNFAASRVLYQWIFKEPELTGVLDTVEKPVLSLSGLKSGNFQSELEKYFERNLATRRISTMLYNQILFSLFNSTDNQSIIVGRDQYLFETAYPQAYLTEVSLWQAEELIEKLKKLSELKQLLNKHGVALAVRMSPTKAEHLPEYLPAAYDRFLYMKQNGKYGPNWYQVFTNEISKTDIPFYDGYNFMQNMKRDGNIIFTKGGTHWTLAPMAEYINGFNALLEELLDKKLGRMIITREENILGKMGIASDSDIWDICWNAFYVKPNYLSPNITLDTIPGEFTPNVLNVGQSFSTVLLAAIYNNIEYPVWDKTYFSWYNSRVLLFPNPFGLPWGEQISEKTDNFDLYLEMDIIVIEFLENTAHPYSTQFEFVENMLEYLKNKENI